MDTRLVSEWHPWRNGNLIPSEFKPKSNKKVWWLCGKNHEWEAVISSRTYGAGCPYCCGHRSTYESSLVIMRPEIALQWHPTLNFPLLPIQIGIGSQKMIWWQCFKGHSWVNSVQNMVKNKKNSCPTCNSLEFKFPEIAEEWHPNRNSHLTLKETTPGSSKNVWWLCQKGHEWQATPYSRSTARDTNCPFCSRKRASKEYNLASCFPNIAKEFHPTKNGLKKPQELKSNSNTKIWWKCDKDHEWEAMVSHRTKNEGRCPRCYFPTSRMERRIYCEFKTLFSKFSEIHNPYILDKTGLSIDVYLPKLNIGVEYDSEFRHVKKDPLIDLRKDKECKNQAILMFRIREKMPKINPWDIVIQKKIRDDKQSQKNVINKLLNKILLKTMLPKTLKSRISTYLNYNNWLNDNEYKTLVPNWLDPEFSLAVKFPNVSKEWHPIKNGSLFPMHFKPKSGTKVWWQCKYGHEWEAVISERTRGRRCPFCMKKKPTPENNLAVKYPKIASQWHPRMNENLLPNEVLPTANKEVWWKCEKGHEWKSRIPSRVYGSLCPDCTKSRVTKDYNLKKENPVLAKEWHPSLNCSLTPSQVTPNSNKKVWWLCEKGHEYQAAVCSRNGRNSNCPFCLGQKAAAETCLTFKMPELASQWHPLKNPNLTPNDVVPGSNKKVWWICKNRHEWEAVISNRVRYSSNCPYCAGQRATLETSLGFTLPKLAELWNTEKNLNLTPYDVLPKSNKKVWWLCKRGHAYEEKVYNRSRKNISSCPFC